MPTDKTYNGWTNYETWNVALWIDNEAGTYHERCDLARHARNISDLATQLKGWVEDMTPNLGASMFADLLNAALSYEEAHEGESEESETAES